MKTIFKIFIFLFAVSTTAQINLSRNVKLGSVTKGVASDSLLVWRSAGDRLYFRPLSEVLAGAVGSVDQTLSISGQNLTISGTGGNTVTLPSTNFVGGNGIEISGSTIRMGGSITSNVSLSLGSNIFSIQGSNGSFDLSNVASGLSYGSSGITLSSSGFRFNTAGQGSAVGQVWTASDVAGLGYWANPPTSGLNDVLAENQSITSNYNIDASGRILTWDFGPSGTFLRRSNHVSNSSATTLQQDGIRFTFGVSDLTNTSEGYGIGLEKTGIFLSSNTATPSARKFIHLDDTGFRFLDETNPPTSGQVWTSSGTNGYGYWADVTGGGSTPGLNDVLAIDQDLSASHNINLNGNTWTFEDTTLPFNNFFVSGNAMGINGKGNLTANIGTLSMNIASTNGTGGNGNFLVNAGGSTVLLNATDANGQAILNTPNQGVILNATDATYGGKVAQLNANDDKAFRYNLAGSSLILSDDNDVPNKKYVDDAIAGVSTGSTEIGNFAFAKVVSGITSGFANMATILDAEVSPYLDPYYIAEVDGDTWLIYDQDNDLYTLESNARNKVVFIDEQNDKIDEALSGEATQFSTARYQVFPFDFGEVTIGTDFVVGNTYAFNYYQTDNTEWSTTFPSPGNSVTSTNSNLVALNNGNLLIDGVNENFIQIKRTGTIGAGNHVDPIFSLGRIVGTGIGEPTFRILYTDSGSDTNEYQGTDNLIFAVEPSGTMASVRRKVGSHVEGFIDGDSEPFFRLESIDLDPGAGVDPSMRIRMGPGGTTANDVELIRRGANQLSLALGGGNKWTTFADGFQLESGITHNFVETVGTPGTPPSNVVKMYNSGGNLGQLTDSGIFEPFVQKEEHIQLACSDLVTDITTGTSKAYFRMPYAGTITNLKVSLLDAGTTTGLTVDVNEDGVSILSTLLTTDTGEKTSTTATTPFVISDGAVADDSEITIDFDAVPDTAKGVIVTIYYTKS